MQPDGLDRRIYRAIEDTSNSLPRFVKLSCQSNHPLAISLSYSPPLLYTIHLHSHSRVQLGWRVTNGQQIAGDLVRLDTSTSKSTTSPRCDSPEGLVRQAVLASRTKDTTIRHRFPYDEKGQAARLNEWTN